MSNNPIVQVFRGLLLMGIISSHNAIATTGEEALAKVQQAAMEQLKNLAATAAWAAPQMSAEVVRTNREIPLCPSGARVESMDPRGLARMRFAVICGGQPGWRQEVLVRGKVSAEVAVAATDLMAGKILSPYDLLQERHDITLIPDTFSDLGQVAGLAARRSIRAGEVLRPNMLSAPQLVRRGDQVRIVARREQIEVSMAGEALDNGARGAIVRVRNASGNTIRARVIEAGTVEPAELPGGN